MLVIEIPELTMSVNELMREYAHPQAKKRERDRWHWLVRKAIGRRREIRPIECCEVTVHRCGPRPLDWDNMGGGLKFLIDALKSNKIVLDDNKKVIQRLHLEQPKVPGREAKTVVEIVPLLDA